MHLTDLSLELTTIGDDALKHLAGLTNLEYLNLYGTHVTDAGLEHLKGMKNLKKLYLWQTRVSFDAAMAFQKSIEGLEVDLGWDHPEVTVTPTYVSAAMVMQFQPVQRSI